MGFSISFIITGVMLGIGLSMDAFSISLVAGLGEPLMKKRKVLFIAGVFALFQGLMPLLGWVLVHTVLEVFGQLEKFIPLTALIILSYIGIKMIIDARRCEKENVCDCHKLTSSAIIIQGVATSIDALSVGLEIATCTAIEAVGKALIISLVTFAICFAGVLIGKKTGTLISKKAGYIGGAILIFIGLEIFIKSLI